VSGVQRADPPPLPSPLPLPLPSPLDAIPDMRSTAKWTVAALGAVGAALLGAVPVSALGRIHGGAAIAEASGGLVLGLGGVAWAVWHTAEALTPPVTTLSALRTDELAPLRTFIDRSPEAFYGPFGTSVAELAAARRLHELLARNLADALATETDRTRLRAIERTLGLARSNADLARSQQRRLLEFAHVWQVRAALRRARVHTLMAVGVIVLGVVLLLVAAAGHSPGAPQSPSPARPAEGPASR
jgi:hypothetical protein